MSSPRPKVLESNNVEFVGYNDSGGSGPFKLALYRKNGSWFLYTGCLWKRGWNIFDVTDPADPKLVNFVRLNDDPQFKHAATTWTIQMDVADGKMITSLQRAPPINWGAEFAPSPPHEEGALIWDISEDPIHPKLLGQYKSGGFGNHRNFYSGGKYAYMCTTPKEFVPKEEWKIGGWNNMLAIVDISDPAMPKEVSRWWWQGQNIAAGETAPLRPYFHGPAYVVGDRAFLSYGRIGLVILDVSNVTNPRLISRFSFGDVAQTLIAGHTAVPIPDRNLVLFTHEPIGGFVELTTVFVIDISDQTNPLVISSFPVPAPSKNQPYRNYWEKAGGYRFGPHNLHIGKNDPNLITPRNTAFVSYTVAGFRVYDVSDKFRPEEVGHFVPEDPKVRFGPQPTKNLVLDFDDVIVDSRGYAYCSEKNTGLYVLKYNGKIS